MSDKKYYVNSLSYQQGIGGGTGPRGKDRRIYIRHLLGRIQFFKKGKRKIMDSVKFTITLGSIEPRTFHKFENGRMVGYGFSIHRDKDGIETMRTKPERLGSLGWAEGESFTEENYVKLLDV
jgi:hypothetical protein